MGFYIEKMAEGFFLIKRPLFFMCFVIFCVYLFGWDMDVLDDINLCPTVPSYTEPN